MHARLKVALLTVTLVASGCNLFGGESAEAVTARREADGRAVGGACRHAGRAIEDCYTLNRRADKASVYAGWREMNDYMRENKLEPVAPQLSAETVAQAAEGASEGKKDKARADKGDKPSDKGTDKADKEKPASKSRGKEPDADKAHKNES
jgi:hypothetical protein